MFCVKCGVQLPDNAAFCYACGTAVNVNLNQQPNVNQQPNMNQHTAYQQPNMNQQAYQPQADTSYMNNSVKADVNIVYPDGHNEIGQLYIAQNELAFHKKSKGVLLAFGMVGNHIQSGELKLRIPTSEIVSGGKTRIGLNSHVYQITLRNGEIYKICFNNPGKISLLSTRFGQ